MALWQNKVDDGSSLSRKVDILTTTKKNTMNG